MAIDPTLRSCLQATISPLTYSLLHYPGTEIRVAQRRGPTESAVRITPSGTLFSKTTAEKIVQLLTSYGLETDPFEINHFGRSSWFIDVITARESDPSIARSIQLYVSLVTSSGSVLLPSELAHPDSLHV